MNSPTTQATHLQSLIKRFYESNESQQQAIKNDLFSGYYQLTAPERQTLRPAMQPFIAEIERELLTINDPVIQAAHELISRLNQPEIVLK